MPTTETNSIARIESAREFYLKLGITELADERRHLYLTVKSIRKIIN